MGLPVTACGSSFLGRWDMGVGIALSLTLSTGPSERPLPQPLPPLVQADPLPSEEAHQPGTDQFEMGALPLWGLPV